MGFPQKFLGVGVWWRVGGAGCCRGRSTACYIGMEKKGKKKESRVVPPYHLIKK